jgi:hypothetical protein
MSMSIDICDEGLDDVTLLWVYGLNAGLHSRPTSAAPASNAYLAEAQRRQMQRYAEYVVRDFGCDRERLASAIDGCVELNAARNPDGILDNGFDCVMELARTARVMLGERITEPSRLTGDFAEQAIGPAGERYRHHPFDRGQLSPRLARWLNSWLRQRP